MQLGNFCYYLGRYGLAGYRLIPAMQKLHLATTQVRTGAAMLDIIAEDFNSQSNLSALLDRPISPNR